MSRKRPQPPVKPFKKKPNPLKAAKITEIDYKDVALLRKFVSDRGKIRSRRITGACRRHQSQVAQAVKRSREIALLPYVAEGGPEPRSGGRGRDRDRDRD